MTNEPTIIRCEEVTPDPVLITLNKITVDVAKISVYNSVRVLKFIQDVQAGTADADEATQMVIDIVNEQGGNLNEETLLKSVNQAQLNAFVTSVIRYTVKTYAPLTARPLTRAVGRTA